MNYRGYIINSDFTSHGEPFGYTAHVNGTTVWAKDLDSIHAEIDSLVNPSVPAKKLIQGLEDVLVLRFRRSLVNTQEIEAMSQEDATEKAMDMAKRGNADILTLGDFQADINVNCHGSNSWTYYYRFVKAVKTVTK